MPPETPPAAPSIEQAWRSFSWLLGGRIVRAILSVIVGAWVARYLGPHDFGRLNAVLAAVLMLSAVTGLGLDSVVRQQLARHPAETGRILGTCLRLRAIAGLVGLLVTLGAAAMVDETSEAKLWIVLGSLLVLQVPLSLDFWFQATLQQRITALAQSWAFTITSIGRVAAIVLHAPVEVFAVLIVVDAPIAASWLWRAYRKAQDNRSTLGWDVPLVRSWLRNAGPLWLSAIATAVLVQANQALLLSVDAAEAGLFAAAQRVFDLVVFVPVALVTTLSPLIARAAGAGPRPLQQMKQHAFSAVAALSWLAALGLLLGATPISEVLFGAAFGPSATALRWLALGLVIHGLFALQTESWVAQGWSQRLLVVTVTAAAINLALAWYWLPRYGAAGAAAARVCALGAAMLGLACGWRETRGDARDLLYAFLGLSWWKSRRPPRLESP
jgi:O-antigen/teichoic acid export membrane protein